MADLFGCAPSPGALASMTRKIAGAIAPALDAVRGALAAAGVAHFDETGFRVAGRLAWVHSASRGRHVLVAVHEKRGKDGMDAAGVLPAFGGIACHDAWAPYDCYSGVAGHALCNAHVLRELAAVTETGTDADVIWARQAIDALLALKKAADQARAAGSAAISAQTLEEHSRWFREAAAAGTALNAGRRTALQKKRHALASRMPAREADYLRFASDPRVPFRRQPGRAGHKDGQAPDQGLRLHAVDARSRDLLRDPLLPRHRRPPRHRPARRPRPRRQRQPLDPPDRINQPGNAAPAARGRTGTCPVMLTAGAGLHLHRDPRTAEYRRARAKPEAG